MIRFSRGPRVLVTIHGSESRASLSLFDAFACEFIDCKASAPLIAWLESYAAKAPQAIPSLLCYQSCSPFQKSVMEQLARIDFGSTISYGELAERLGDPRAARAVGGACNKNPFPLFYPCHRVVSKRGVGGFALDIEIKKRLLDFEERE